MPFKLKQSRKIIFTVLLSVTAVIIMTLIENHLKYGYWCKSLMKIIVFCGSIFLYSRLYGKSILQTLNINRKKPSRKLIILMAGVYAIVIVGYLLLKDHIDLVTIRQNLMNKENLTVHNFYWIFGYIIFFNSLLEESFFRGFIYHCFKEEGMPRAGMVFGSILFSLYHIGIMSSWFNPLVFILALISLTVAGIMLQYVEIRNDNLLASYLVHGSANLAINTIGTLMILFQ